MYRKVCIGSWFAILVSQVILSGCAIIPSPVLSQKSKLKLVAHSTSSSSSPRESLEITFLGNTTIAMASSEGTIITDGFLTRPSWLKVLRKINPDRERVISVLNAAGVADVIAVIPLHSHYDHLMDAPLVAEHFGAKLFATATTEAIVRNMQDHHCLSQAKPLETFNIGFERTEVSLNGFDVYFEHNKHVDTGVAGRLFAPRKMGYREYSKLDGDFCTGVKPRKYVEGESYNLYLTHKNSDAEIAIVTGVPDGDFANINCKLSQNQHPLCKSDVVFVSLPLFDREKHRLFTDDFKNILGSRASSVVVIPVHWDAFTKSISLDTAKIERSDRLSIFKVPSMKRAKVSMDRGLADMEGVELLWVTAFDKLTVGSIP